MVRLLRYLGVIVSTIALTLGAPARAQDPAPNPAPNPAPDQQVPARSQAKDAAADGHTPKPVEDAAEPDHIRGQVTLVEASLIAVKTREGKTLSIGLHDNTTVIGLSKGSFAEVDFGIYVGAVAVKLEEYSPIVRDSAVWLHKGFELRIIDDKLRGIALGHRKWDLTSDSIISHGWVDDLEVRVLSIKWGPTDYDETDVEVPRDVPIHKMSLADKSLIKPGMSVFVGALKGSDGKYAALFVIVGKDGLVPAL
ncbi:hypothetical protein C7T35_22725 [Variovorax sp. WS11]|uniref:hypothetical protein n=1 Tax=Variovorax sp. WS11 TaxID=1105204 RepID=UPI000D0D2424|nr:hypothetical protein [Variovorax sp. WS11]NDZ11782.1 hypothetical protein [Variovorax sp. WS11]PSL82323.1 hypothetical protein C7T35_22725 [Variovorax sp. WS11]